MIAESIGLAINGGTRCIKVHELGLNFCKVFIIQFHL